jgi:transposase InsO family protein
MRGRPPREPSLEQRLEVRELLDEEGPRLGLPSLQESCPETPWSLLAYLQTEYRRQFQQDHQLVVEALHWHRPGAVWAIDHSKPPQPVDGCHRQILAVRDLASGMQLAWSAVAGATADEALLVLEMLVRQYGPPLVLKSDNGSAFISHSFQEWLDDWQITPLFSPIRMPRYNGACEAGIGAAKRRTEYLAARQDRFLNWTSDDLYAAQLWANHDNYPWGRSRGTPADRFTLRSPITENERDTFQAAVVQCERQLQHELCTPDQQLTDKCSALIHRRAVRCALVELGYLDITRRSIPQPIHTAKCARIT